jgi:hypothetical protein
MSTHANKTATAHRKGHKLQGRPPFECIALLLQGGGALGATSDLMSQATDAGYHDTVRTLRHPEILERPKNAEGVLAFDLAQDGRE